MKSDTVHIGVDVSKGKLDIYVPAKKEGSRPLTLLARDLSAFENLIPMSVPRTVKMTGIITAAPSQITYANTACIV